MLQLRPEIARSGVLLAWSGGLDSTVLLYQLREWAAQNGAALHAIHVDHGLRESSHKDVAFCRRVAAKLGVPLWVENLDIPSAGSTQQNARIQRYASIARAANWLGLGAVLTAHHADDALETALLNLRRGTSTAGLSASGSTADPPIPGWPGDLFFERPFMGVFRNEILAFARKYQLDWHDDPSNAASGYQRNRLRHEVLPGLTQNGRYSPGILRSLQNLSDENSALDAVAESTLRSAWLTAPDAESIALRCGPLHTLPSALATRAVQLAAHRLPTEVALTRTHRDALARAISQREARRLDVRGGVIQITRHILLLEVARGRGAPHLHKRSAGAISLPDSLSTSPSLSRSTNAEADPNSTPPPWFGTSFGWRESPTGNKPSYFYDFGPAAESDATQFIIRGPKPGDRMKIHGLNGHKSVTSLLSEAGIPDFLRWRWPCLVDANHNSLVEWVCGIRHGARRISSTGEKTAQHRLHWKLPAKSVFSHILTHTTPESS